MSGTKTTEEDILSRVDGANDDGESSSAQQGSEQGAATSTTEADTADKSATAVDGAGSESGGANPPLPVDAKLQQVPNANDPRAKDLVDPATGQVVARGGVERRIFEGAAKIHRQNVELQTKMQQSEQERTAAQTQLAAYKQANGMAERLALSPQEREVAYTVLDLFKRNPVEAVERMIAEVKAKGHTIPSLTNAGGSDMAAVQRMMDERLQPVLAPQRQAQQEQEARAAASRELDGFLAQVPDAKANLDTIGEMLSKDQSLTLPMAWAKLVTWSYQRRLDPSQPLAAQIQALQQQPTNEQVLATPGANPSRNAPLPNGNPQPIANGSSEQKAFDADSSMSDIIKSAMRENGYAV